MSILQPPEGASRSKIYQVFLCGFCLLSLSILNIASFCDFEIILPTIEIHSGHRIYSWKVNFLCSGLVYFSPLWLAVMAKCWLPT